MTVLDWAIVAFTLALGLWGYRQGLIVGALTLVGFGVGAFAGSRLDRCCSSEGSESPYAPLCAALGALLAGALVAVTLESLALGLRARLIRRQVLHLADGAGGAALIAAVALGVVWVFGAVALHAPGTAQLRADVQALADPAQPQRSPAAVGADPARVGPGRPGTFDHRPGGTGRAARLGDRQRPRRGRRRAIGGAGARDGMRARGRGIGMGRRGRAWSSPTPTSSPARTTPR